MQAVPAAEHVEVSVEQQKKNIKERLEENRQEVKKQEKQQKVKKSIQRHGTIRKTDVGVDENRKFLRKI